MIRRLQLSMWCIGLVLVLLALHAMGDDELAAPLHPQAWRGWVIDAGPAVVIVAILRLIAMALTWYLVITTVVGAATRVWGRARAVAMADAVAPPFLRRLLVSAGGLAASGAGLAIAAAPLAVGIDRAASAVDVGDATDSVATLKRVSPVAVPLASQGATPDESSDDAPPSTADFAVVDLSGLGAALAAADHVLPRDDAWEVRCGDHLWMIAEEVLEDVTGSVPDEERVADYWRVLIDANRDRLVAPDNPDLLVPGQVLTIPAPVER